MNLVNNTYMLQAAGIAMMNKDTCTSLRVDTYIATLRTLAA